MYTYVCVIVKIEYMYTTWHYCFSIVPRPKKEGTGDAKDLLRKEVTKIFNECYGN